MTFQNRYDFVYLFDVKDGNPNGDPDAGNLPRMDPETGRGLVTDVCLKRKIRNYIQLTQNGGNGFDIYIKEKAVLGRAHYETFNELNIHLGEETKTEIPDELIEAIEELSLPEGLEITVDEETEKPFLTITPVTDKKDVKDWLKEEELDKKVKKFIEGCLKGVKARKPKADETEKGQKRMCERFFDIRTFGAVLSLATAPNCGQVRGPVQFTFARSMDPIVPLEHSITRMAVATEAEAEKQGGDNRTMGRKHTIPYGLYRAHGFISANLAEKTGFSEEDLDLLWKALQEMFDHDRSAARGEMAARKLVVFKHDSSLGNAPAHTLFERVQVQRKDGDKPPREFSDYEVAVNNVGLPSGVTIEELL